MPNHIKFKGGVHPDDGKLLSCAAAIIDAPLLASYTIPIQQHIGAPAKLLVDKGDTVKKGQLLAEPGGFVSAALHAPTSGAVKAITECMMPNGSTAPAIELESDGEDTAEFMPPIADWEAADAETLRKRIADAGIVGMGGAAFPTHVKLSPPPAKPIDTVILNGVECEPCLTADHRLMLENPEKILQGALMVRRAVGANRVVVGIERNKPDAIVQMQDRARKLNVEVVDLRVRYPQGAEKQLIYAVTGRRVPTGGLPMDVGCVVQNVGTCLAVAEAMLEGKPLFERVTTITGTPVASPGNWRFRIGTPLHEALKLAGGVVADPAKIISGGPMMGLSIYSLDVPILKSSSGILLLAPDEVAQYTSEPCINCGACVDACPMNLRPGPLSVYIENERFDLAETWRAQDCIECGCCAYACPSNRPLVQHLRRAKGEIMAKRRAEKK
jgi:electron transport complex protein RnfC